MNWLAFGLSWLAGMIFFLAGYRFGLSVGHMRGHRCEAVMQHLLNTPMTNEELMRETAKWVDNVRKEKEDGA